MASTNICTIDTRNPHNPFGYSPITRRSYDGQAENIMHYEITAHKVVLNDPKKLKGIVIQTYGAIDNISMSSNALTQALAEQGYLVCFVRGHTLAQQTGAGGARSTIRDTAYFASLIKGRATIDRQIKKLEDELAGKSPQQQRKIQQQIAKLRHSTLVDAKGVQPLNGLLTDVDVPLIMHGASQGGTLTLDTASNKEPFEYRHTVKHADGTQIEQRFGPSRYDEPFDAFVAESPWFRKDELELCEHAKTPQERQIITAGAMSRWQHANHIKEHGQTWSFQEVSQDWQMATYEKEKGMEHLSDAYPLDPMRNAEHIQKPVLLLQSQRDDNTPVILTAQFAQNLIGQTDVLVKQYYYGSRDVDRNPVSHRYAGASNLVYVSSINHFCEQVKLVGGRGVERTIQDFQTASALYQVAKWGRHDFTSHWHDLSTLYDTSQLKVKKESKSWWDFEIEEVNAIQRAAFSLSNITGNEMPFELMIKGLQQQGISLNKDSIQSGEMLGRFQIFLSKPEYEHLRQSQQAYKVYSIPFDDVHLLLKNRYPTIAPDEYSPQLLRQTLMDNGNKLLKSDVMCNPLKQVYMVTMTRDEKDKLDQIITGLKSAQTAPMSRNASLQTISNAMKLIQAQHETLEKELKSCWKRQRQRKDEKQKALSSLIQKNRGPEGRLTKRDIDEVMTKKEVVAGMFTGGFFTNRTTNLLTDLRKILPDETVQTTQPKRVSNI